MDAPPPSPSDDAARWLAAAATRIEDDPALLDALSDEEVATLLAAENARPDAVATGIRRRVREAERMSVRPLRRWRWPAAGALALAAALAVFALRPTATDADDAVLAYRTELAAFAEAAPPVKGAAPDRRAAVADLVAAAEADPPDADRARRAAEAFAEIAEAGVDDGAAFFAALAYRLAGDEAAAAAWFDRVPPTSPFADGVPADR